MILFDNNLELYYILCYESTTDHIFHVFFVCEIQRFECAAHSLTMCTGISVKMFTYVDTAFSVIAAQLSGIQTMKRTNTIYKMKRSKLFKLPHILCQSSCRKRHDLVLFEQRNWRNKSNTTLQLQNYV